MDSSIDRYLRVALRALAAGHAPGILERIQPGEIGCVSCGHVGPAESFARQRTRGWAGDRLCPACGINISRHGLIDGSALTARTAREELAQVS